MPANTVVFTHTDKPIKDETLQFKSPELSTSTLKAMKEARQGSLKSFDSIEDLMADLNAEG
ncbi:hypothetical protein [Pseudomonas gingeri]|uniref:Uncharacterized protein n=1 Tax=Pseudomonas gingeri TaxID=117681 RepID=A0A7Y7WVU2_9PSED|nr:hypothetical protein [Pseudomonas gingeri]NWB87507.1 hypothetical protein [Pseudomonas gingeri]